MDPDDDIDDKAIARARQQRQQSAPAMTTSSDDEADETPQPISLPPKLPVRQQAPVAAGETATERRQEYNVGSTAEPVPVPQLKPIYSVFSAMLSSDQTMWASSAADKRSVLNEMYAVRRASAFAHRLGALHGDATELPIDATSVRPVLISLPDQSKQRVNAFVESRASNESLLILEYGSAFLSDNLISYNQGDEFGFGFSDTHVFSNGRALTITDNPNDPNNVPPKRLASADDDDIAPRTIEAVNYQHSFLPSFGRYDAALPVSTFDKLVASDASIDEYIVKLKAMDGAADEEADNNSISTNVADFLERSRAGVASLFSVLSTAVTTQDKDYSALAFRADRDQVTTNLATSVEQARAAEARGINIDSDDDDDDDESQDAIAAGNKTAASAAQVDLLAAYECLSNMEDMLAERAEGAELPHMVRVRSSGPFTVVGSVIEYDLNRPAGSLVDAATGSEAAPDDWNALGPLLAARERNGVVFDAVKNVWREQMLQVSKSTGVNVKLEKRQEIERENELRAALNIDALDATMNVRKRVAESERKKKQRSSPSSSSDSGETTNKPKKRRIQQKSNTISTEAKEGKTNKRKADEDDDDDDDGDEEESGEDIEDDEENIEMQEKDLLEEGFELGEEFDALRIGRKSKGRKNKDTLTALRSVDPSAVGYLDIKAYQFPMIAVPIGWSCIEALRSLTTEFRVAQRPDLLWKSASAWKLIIELAVYCKLVPSMRTPVWFPLEARSKLLYTLEVLSMRVTNEITYHDDSRDVFLKLVKNRGISLKKEIRDINAVLAQKETQKNREKRLEAQTRLPFAVAELEDHENNNNLTRAALPSLLSIDVLTDRELQHFDTLRGEMQGVLFNETQRLALAIAYTAAGVRHENAQSLMQTVPLAKSQTQVADELLYPQDISYRQKLDQLVGDQSVNMIGVLLKFAQLTNSVQKLTENEAAINEQTAGAYLDRLVASLEQDPSTFTQTRKSLAQVLYPELLRRRHVNVIKHVYVVPPSLAGIESFRRASKMMEYIFSDSGVFTTEALVELYERELENIAKRAKEAFDIRGSERSVASAAQRYVNEFAPQSRFSLDDVALVPADFAMNSPAKPVGVFTVIDKEVVVDRKKTLELLSSDAFLGRGHVAVSSAAVTPADDDTIAKTAERIKAVRAYIDDATSESASVDQADEDAVEATQTQIAAANEYLQELLRQLQNAIPSGADENTRTVLFCYVVSPSTLFDICNRVVAAGTARFEVAQACQIFITWYGSTDATVAYAVATYESLIEYKRFLLNTFVPALMATPKSPLLVDTPAQLSRDEFASLVVAALIDATPRMPVVREETTRADAVVTQPFSDLAALELATDRRRDSIREALTNIWYELSDYYRWPKLGYTSMPFNTSVSLGLLPANLNNGAYSTHQTLHLAIRHALRVLQNSANNEGVDEGDSDDESTKKKTTEQLASERVRGVQQLRTLLKALEREVSLVQHGSTLWFDLFAVGRKADEFGASVRSALATIYKTLQAGRDVATINLLANRSSQTPPLALDVRAQDLINSYWKDYDVANIQQHDELNDLFYALYADDTQTFFNIVDSAFYTAVARENRAKAAASSVVNADVDTARKALETKIKAAQNASEAERKKPKTGDVRKIPSFVDELVKLEEQEAAADNTLAKLEAIKLNTSAFDDDDDDAKQFASMTEDQRQQQQTKLVDERTTVANKIAKLQQQIRAAYRDDSTRTDRIDELLTAIPDLAAEIRDGSRTTIDPSKKLVAYQTELRATMYDDERPQYEATVSKLIEAKELELSKSIAQRVTISMMNELQVEIRHANDSIKELQTLHEQNVAAQTEKARRLPESQRAAALANIERDPNEQQRAALAAYAKRVADLEVLKKSLQHYDPSIIDESLRNEAEELRNKLIQRIADRPRPPLGTVGRMNYAKKEAEIIAARNTLRNLRNAIELRADQRARTRLSDQRKDVKEAEKAKATSAEEKLEKKRDAVAKEITKIVKAKSQTDERIDNVGIRVKNSRATNTEIPTFSGFYDAPLANHKAITAEGVKLATALLRAVEKPEDIIKRLTAVLSADAHDAFVQDALKTIDFLLAVNEEEEVAAPLKMRLDVTSGSQNQALYAYVANVVEAAIKDRLKLRYQASAEVDKSTVQGISENDVVKRGIVVANNALNGLLSTTKLSGKTLRKIDFAALSIVRRDFVRYSDWLRAQSVLRQFATTTVEIDDNTKVDIPSILVPLILPAAIERAKISLQEKAAPKTDVLWAVAHCQDAPQALRISEMVERFALTAVLPLMSQSAAEQVSPFVQYKEIRSSNDKVKQLINMRDSVLRDITKQENDIAKVETNKEIDADERAAIKENAERKIRELEVELGDLRSKIAYPFDENTSLSALGRLRSFDDRVAALKSLGVTRQRVSFGNGLHYSQPFGCDLLLAALCAKLMQIYLSVQNAFGSEKLDGLAALWTATQTNEQAISTTQQIALMTDPKERLWAHLSMIYATRGTKLDLPFNGGAASLPVWQCMRPVDIRLLALVLLGYDVSSRANEAPDDSPQTLDTAYAYTRGHSAKLMFAQAYYEEYVELQFIDVPDNVPANRVEQTEVLYTITRSSTTQQLQSDRRHAKRGAPRSAKIDNLVAQLNESELNNAVRRHIITAWTAPVSRLIVTFQEVGSATIGDQVKSFATGSGSARTLVEKAVIKAAAATADASETTIVDHAWLLIPRCVIIGAMVRLATNPRNDKPFPGRLGVKAARKQRLLSTIERVLLLCDDSGHLLRSDGWRVSGQDLAQLDGVPIVPIPAAEFVAADATIPSTATLPSTTVPSVIHIDEWARRLGRAHSSLLGYDKTMVLVGTSRTPPYTAVEWPFSPVSRKMPLLMYTHSVAFLDASLNDAWAAVKSVLGVVSSAFATNTVAASIEQSPLSPQQKILGSLIARSELKRRQVWTIDASGVLTNTSQKRSIAETDVRNSPYQHWYTLLMSALSKDANPKDALRSFVTRHEGEPKVGALALAERLVNDASSARITALQVEQIVPLYETLLYTFQTDSAEPYLQTQRHTLWPLLLAPLYQRAIVCTSTTAMRDALTGMELCTVQLASLDAKKAPRAYLPIAAFEAGEAFEEAKRIPIADRSRVTILHEHQFAKLAEKDETNRAPSSMTTLARVKLVDDALETTVDDVLQHAFQQETAYIINTSIPLPSKQ